MVFFVPFICPHKKPSSFTSVFSLRSSHVRMLVFLRKSLVFRICSAISCIPLPSSFLLICASSSSCMCRIRIFNIVLNFIADALQFSFHDLPSPTVRHEGAFLCMFPQLGILFFVHPEAVLCRNTPTAFPLFCLFEHTYLTIFVVEYPTDLRNPLIVLPSGSILLCRSCRSSNLLFHFSLGVVKSLLCIHLYPTQRLVRVFINGSFVARCTCRFFDLLLAFPLCVFFLLCFHHKLPLWFITFCFHFFVKVFVFEFSSTDTWICSASLLAAYILCLLSFTYLATNSAISAPSSSAPNFASSSALSFPVVKYFCCLVMFFSLFLSCRSFSPHHFHFSSRFQF